MFGHCLELGSTYLKQFGDNFCFIMGKLHERFNTETLQALYLFPEKKKTSKKQNDFVGVYLFYPT